jgi:hypothetical protein
MNAKSSPGLWLGAPLADSKPQLENSVYLPPAKLTTHGVIVGMTGSGKTGLGCVFLEEALRQEIPLLILDPKGDMGNLGLCFPSFSAQEFAPWIDGQTAALAGMSVDEYAHKVANSWQEGLSSWKISAEDLSDYKNKLEVKIYTPKSDQGIPINITGSMAVPKNDQDLEEVAEAFVSGLLNLLGLNADPLTSREHILLSSLMTHAWRQGQDMDFTKLINQVQNPPLRKLGVFEVDTFYPAGERMSLAMRLNGLLAAPTFSDWLQGEDIDFDRWFQVGPKVRANIVSLAHLSENERQFVLSLILSRLVSWMRKQPGTQQLRALVYLDEVFGFVPPTQNPPSKKPILTILKQARAHGIGMLLATQNPVDLDYKALGNAGTWMIGRLQTERDKKRMLEGLQQSAGQVDLGQISAQIGQLDKREFVLHQSGKDLTRFSTRWAMSYLRGPMTLYEIERLKDKSSQPQPAAIESKAEDQLADNESQVPPNVPDNIRQVYLHPAAELIKTLERSLDSNRLEAALAVRVQIRFDDRRAGIDHLESFEALATPLNDNLNPDELIVVDYDQRDFIDDQQPQAVYVLPEASLANSSFYKEFVNRLEEHIYHENQLSLYKNRHLKLISRPKESQEDFLGRCHKEAENQADQEATKLRDKFQIRLIRLQDRLAAAERRAREAKVALETRSQAELLSGAGELISLFLGGRKSVRGLARMASRRGTSRRAEAKVHSALEKVEDIEEDIRELEEDLTEDLIEIDDNWQSKAEDIESFEIRLEKNDIHLDEVILVWVPAR